MKNEHEKLQEKIQQTQERFNAQAAQLQEDASSLSADPLKKAPKKEQKNFFGNLQTQLNGFKERVVETLQQAQEELHGFKERMAETLEQAQEELHGFKERIAETLQQAQKPNISQVPNQQASSTHEKENPVTAAPVSCSQLREAFAKRGKDLEKLDENARMLDQGAEEYNKGTNRLLKKMQEQNSRLEVRLS